MIRKRALQNRIDVLEHQVDNLQTSNRSRDTIASLNAAREAQDRAVAAAKERAPHLAPYMPPYWTGLPRCRCCGNLAGIGRESCAYCFAHCRYTLRATQHQSGGWTHTPPPPWGPPSCDHGVHIDASGRVCGGVHHYEPCQKCGRVNWTRTPTCGCGDPACGGHR